MAVMTPRPEDACGHSAAPPPALNTDLVCLFLLGVRRQQRERFSRSSSHRNNRRKMGWGVKPTTLGDLGEINQLRAMEDEAVGRAAAARSISNFPHSHSEAAGHFYPPALADWAIGQPVVIRRIYFSLPSAGPDVMPVSWARQTQGRKKDTTYGESINSNSLQENAMHSIPGTSRCRFSCSSDSQARGGGVGSWQQQQRRRPESPKSPL
ncbi:unnamed protein product [Pleuronectes platessa]|uniref:Uncharacterized protein n=1 Tax=Pleuronectes platessa TaxID=8262 RepID=A0A9N7U3N9_PLEPL|nr:unnamed protein product [Pleuronectes platessa]